MLTNGIPWHVEERASQEQEADYYLLPIVAFPEEATPPNLARWGLSESELEQLLRERSYSLAVINVVVVDAVTAEGSRLHVRLPSIGGSNGGPRFEVNFCDVVRCETIVDGHEGELEMLIGDIDADVSSLETDFQLSVRQGFGSDESRSLLELPVATSAERTIPTALEVGQRGNSGIPSVLWVSEPSLDLGPEALLIDEASKEGRSRSLFLAGVAIGLAGAFAVGALQALRWRPRPPA